jgi:hypothetical protein
MDMRHFLLIYGLITACSIVLFWICFVLYSSSKINRRGQPLLLHMQHFGGILACIFAMLSYVNPVNQHICYGRFWLLHLSFSFMVGSMFIKVSHL